MKDRLRAFIFGKEAGKPETTVAHGEVIFTRDAVHNSGYPDGEEKKKLRQNATRVLGIARQRGALPRFPRQ